MPLSPSAAVPAPLTKLWIWHAGKGLKVGLMRPITIWPLADRQIKELASKVKGILVHELNYGQYVLEVDASSQDRYRLRCTQNTTTNRLPRSAAS
ncbi:MAG: hypothetical protein ACLVLP_10870 [Phascolarctobacterium faecium]|uniref:hypothetical protein n=1 Tax=Phascolarctobacterium faecium TaxID=33025 RepID=UPI00399A04FD